MNESLVRNSGEIAWPTGSRTTKSASSSVSQRPAARRRRPASSRSGASRRPRRSRASARRDGLRVSRHGGRSFGAGAASRRRPTRRSNVIATSSSAPIAACCQKASTLSTISDEVIVPQQQRAERRAVDAARAAEDRDAADDGGRDDGQLVAGAGGRVDGAEAGGEQHPARGRRARRTARRRRTRAAPSGRRRAGRPRGSSRSRTARARSGSRAAPGRRSTTTTSAIRASVGMPRIEPVPRLRNASGSVSALTWRPFVHRNATPRKTYSVPSVTTSAGTWPKVTRTPLSAPQAAPSSIPRTITTGIGRLWCDDSRSPAMNAASPSTEPTDRSTLRVMITSVWPAARIAKIDALRARLRSESAVDEARLDDRRDEHEQRERGDDAELADAEDPVGQAARLGAGDLRGRRPAALTRPPPRSGPSPRA